VNASHYVIRALTVSFAMSRPNLASTKRPIQLLRMTDSPEEDAGGCEGTQSSPSRADVNRPWSCVSTPPYANMT
jgi:hypothetical protein